MGGSVSWNISVRKNIPQTKIFETRRYRRTLTVAVGVSRVPLLSCVTAVRVSVFGCTSLSSFASTSRFMCLCYKPQTGHVCQLTLHIAMFRIIAAGRTLLCLNLDYDAFADDQRDINSTVSLICYYYWYVKFQCLPHRKHAAPALMTYLFACLLTYLSTYLLACLLTYLPTYLHIHLLT